MRRPVEFGAPEILPSQVAWAINLAEASGRPPVAPTVTSLGDKTILNAKRVEQLERLELLERFSNLEQSFFL